MSCLNLNFDGSLVGETDISWCRKTFHWTGIGPRIILICYTSYIRPWEVRKLLFFLRKSTILDGRRRRRRRENVEIKPPQPPSWGWGWGCGWGLSSAIIVLTVYSIFRGEIVYIPITFTGYLLYTKYMTGVSLLSNSKGFHCN